MDCSTPCTDGDRAEPDDPNGVIEFGSEVLRPEADIEPDPSTSLASAQAGPSSNPAAWVGFHAQGDGEHALEEQGKDLGQDGAELRHEHPGTRSATDFSGVPPPALGGGAAAGPSSKKTKKKKTKGKASTGASPVKNSSGRAGCNIGSGKKSLENTLGLEGRQLVIDRLRAQNGDAMADQVAALGPKDLGRLMDQIHLLDLMKGTAGTAGKNKKDMADHKFWSTQPVRRLDEKDSNFEEGEIEPDKVNSEVRQSPLPLPDGYEWCTLDLSDPNQLRELYELLTMNYVEDDDAMFRFDYTAPFIDWALRPPGFVQDWHVAVRVASGKRRLIAFISGVPMNLRVRSIRKNCAEINFLCIHKKLRSKRLAPVLIKEITRRCNVRGTFQAIYTAGVLLPTPISRCQYFHRTLDPAKLINTGFSAQPRGVSVARLRRKYECPSVPRLPGLREMEDVDVPAVGTLLRRYMARFDLAPIMSDEEVRHHFISGKGRGEPINGRREGQVTWSFVVENPENHLVTDFVSFYHLPSTAMKSTPHETIDAAYLFYYATVAAPSCASLGEPHGTADLEPNESQVQVACGEERTWSQESPEEKDVLKKRLVSLVGDALGKAQAARFDVFNALTLMDNSLFVGPLQFGAGDGFLHYYLYNWKVHHICGGLPTEPGMEAEPPSTAGSGIGVVML